MVVPAGTVVRMQVIGADVIHPSRCPSLGFKIDAIPAGSTRPGSAPSAKACITASAPSLRTGAAGDANDLHGHSFMPIAVRAVAPDKFAAWVAAAKRTSGRLQAPRGERSEAAPVKVAGAVRQVNSVGPAR